MRQIPWHVRLWRRGYWSWRRRLLPLLGYCWKCKAKIECRPENVCLDCYFASL